MNILHIDCGADWRGGQSQVLLALRGQRDRGHNITLLAPKNSPLLERGASEQFRCAGFSRGLNAIGAATLLRKILRQGCDIVHAHDAHALTAAWLARAHRHAMLFASRRVAYPLGKSPWALSRYRAARNIIAVSQFVAGSVITSGISASRVAVVYDGVEVPEQTTAASRQAAREKLGLAPGDFVLGCVGQLLPEKGQRTLIEAMPKILLQYPRARLLLVGGGPLRQQLEGLARQRGLSSGGGSPCPAGTVEGDSGVHGAIRFTGFLPDTEGVYRALDAFVFPSTAEPLGSALLEAMAYGLPVVAVSSGGVPEIVRSEVNGLLVAPAPAPSAIRGSACCVEPSASAFASAVLRLRSEPETSQRLAQGARATIIERFTAGIMVERTLQIYEAACAGQSHQG